jgi:hypothetical protein
MPGHAPENGRSQGFNVLADGNRPAGAGHPLRHRAEGLVGLTRPALADRGRRRFPADLIALAEGLALQR